MKYSKDITITFSQMLASKPEKHDLIVTSSSHSMDPCICLIKHKMLGVSKDQYLVPIDPNDYVKTHDEKLKAHGTMDGAVGSVEVKSKPKLMMWSSPLLDIGNFYLNCNSLYKLTIFDCFMLCKFGMNPM